MTDKKLLAAIRTLTAYLKKNKLTKPCGEHRPSCPACQYYVLYGMLQEWEEVIEYANKLKKKK